MRSSSGIYIRSITLLLYINYISNVSDKLFSTFIADDTNAFLTGYNLNDLISTKNSELDKIMMWLNVNKLSLNVSKSHYILFSNNKIKPDSNVIMNGQIVERVSSTKFLGVCID